MRRSTTRVLATVAAVLATLALTGCVKLDEDLTVNTDNTVDGKVTVAFNKALLDMMGATAEDALGETGGMSESAHVSVEPYEDDTFVGQTYILEDAPLDELNATSGGEDDLQIVRDGDTFHVSGTLDFTDSALGGDGSAPNDGFEARIALTFPGRIVSSTGDIDGNTVTWTPDLGDVVDFETVAEARDGGGGAGTALLAAGGLGLGALAAGGVALAMFQRRKAGGTGGPVGAPPAPAYPAAPVGAADLPAPEPWAIPGADSSPDSWSAPAGDPRYDVDAAPPAAVPFDPAED